MRDELITVTVERRHELSFAREWHLPFEPPLLQKRGALQACLRGGHKQCCIRGISYGRVSTIAFADVGIVRERRDAQCMLDCSMARYIERLAVDVDCALRLITDARNDDLAARYTQFRDSLFTCCQ